MKSNSKSVRSVGAAILCKVAKSNRHADLLLEDAFLKNEYSHRDKGLLLELVNGTLRQRGRINWILVQLFHGDFAKSPFLLQSILQIALYQLIFLDKIPEYAAVSEAVTNAKMKGGQKWASLVTAILKEFLRKKETLSRSPVNPDDPIKELAVRASHPEWLVKRWHTRYGLEKTTLFCEYNNQRPVLSLRINPEKIAPVEVVELLEKRGYKVAQSAWFSDFIRIKSSSDIFREPLFLDGCITIQDESTAIAPRLLDPKPNERILDMCAAPGGKTCYMAQMMSSKGKIFAVEKEQSRIRKLVSTVKRLDTHIIETVHADAMLFAPEEPVDKILIDTPCSGLGVLAKRADLRWRRVEDDILVISSTQKQLLKTAASLVKAGGSIVYSACTIEPEETEIVIREFIAEHPDFHLSCSDSPVLKPFLTDDGFYRSLPFVHNIDGTFSVKIART